MLSDVSVDIPYGTITGVLGLNGSGKSTLFNVIAGFVDFDGEVIKEKAYDVAYMSTDNLFFSDMKLRDIVKFYKDFMPGFDAERAERELNSMQLNPKKTYGRLSMGQKRIVAFVMTVCSKAKIYLFDEPLTNLDILYREYLINTLISDIDETKAFVISSHELMELENVFSHVVILKDNKLGELTDTEDIRASGQSIAEFYKEAVR